MTPNRTNDRPLFEAVIETKEDEENWERIMGRKPPKKNWPFDDCFVTEEQKLYLAEIARWVLENQLLRESVARYLDVNDEVLEDLEERLNGYLDIDDPAEDALLNHEVMNGEVQSDIEFPDGEFDDGKHCKGE